VIFILNKNKWRHKRFFIHFKYLLREWDFYYYYFKALINLLVKFLWTIVLLNVFYFYIDVFIVIHSLPRNLLYILDSVQFSQKQIIKSAVIVTVFFNTYFQWFSIWLTDILLKIQTRNWFILYIHKNKQCLIKILELVFLVFFLLFFFI
jgi:hypothetical protein